MGHLRNLSRHLTLLLLICAAILLTALPVLAQDGGTLDAGTPSVTTPDDANGVTTLVLKGTREKKWAMAAGAVLMLVVLSLRKALPTVDKKWLPLVTLVVAGVPALAAALMHPDGVNMEEAGTAMVAIWLLASGSWSAIAEPIRELVRNRQRTASTGNSTPAPAPTQPPPASQQ